MIDKEKYLLVKIQEECAEVSQRAAKAIRFGLKEIQNGQNKSNAERLRDEILDLFASLVMFEDEVGVELLSLGFENFDELIDNRIERIKKYMDYSRKIGELDD